MAFDGQLAAEGGRLAPELALPERVTNDRARSAAATAIVVGGKQASEEWLRLQDLEKISTDVHPLGVPGLAARSKVEVVGGPSKDAGKALLVVAAALRAGRSGCSIVGSLI
jgi:hypothetical protein